MSFETVLCEIAGSVATVTLNRPKVLNALNAQVFDELEAVFTALAADTAVRVILITGAGEKAFAAGADIKELAGADAVGGEAFGAAGAGGVSADRDLREAGDRAGEWVCAGGWVRVGAGVHDEDCERDGAAGAAGGEAGADSGVWGDAAFAEISGIAGGAEDDVDG